MYTYIYNIYEHCEDNSVNEIAVLLRFWFLFFHLSTAEQNSSNIVFLAPMLHTEM